MKEYQKIKRIIEIGIGAYKKIGDVFERDYKGEAYYLDENNCFLQAPEFAFQNFKMMGVWKDDYKLYWEEEYFPVLTLYEAFIQSAIFTVSGKVKDESLWLKVEEMIDAKAFLSYLIHKNTFTKVTPHLERLGITNEFIESLKEGFNYYPICELCNCELIDCFSRSVWIIKEQDRFIIPFFTMESGSSFIYETDIDAIEPTEPNPDPELAAIFPLRDKEFDYYEKCIFKNDFLP